MIPGSTGPIFNKFLPYDRYLMAYYRSDPFFQWLKGHCHGNQY